MARLPRIVIPGLPHHGTQRGNRRAQTFSCDEDYALYKHPLSGAAEKAGSEKWHSERCVSQKQRDDPWSMIAG